jgi:hypothetical protein
MTALVFFEESEKRKGRCCDDSAHLLRFSIVNTSPWTCPMLRRKSKRSNSGSSPTSPDSGTQQLPVVPQQGSPPRTRIGPGHQALPLPSTVQRTQSKDEMSVVSDLTGLSDLNSHPAHNNTNNTNNGGGGNQPLSPAVHATSLLSSQLDPSQVLSALSSLGGIQASTSFDTGFDTALHVLPEETPSVLRASSSVATSASASNVNNDVRAIEDNHNNGINNQLGAEKPSSSPSPSSSQRDEGEEEEIPTWIDFLNDPTSEMTYSRRLALWLMKFQWYYKPKVPEGDQMESEAVGTSTVFGKGGIGQLSFTATEAYPFSHSRRETPSLEKAWACTF